MGKSTQKEKNSLLGSRLGRFAGKLMKRPQRSNKVLSPGVEPEKQKKAIGHIEKLLEQIAQLQDEIENSLQVEKCLEREIFDLAAASEPSTHKVPQRKQIKVHKKKQADKLPVTKKPVRKRKKRSHKNTK